MVTIKCHECDKELNISNDSIKGEIVTCPDCGSDFEIVNIFVIKNIHLPNDHLFK